uniref:Ubiquitin-like-conjugating enzyme ATG10 n=1 Tax=Trichuris muris TaxID=70415 RepID=A0A5S6QBN8_TRIMR
MRSRPYNLFIAHLPYVNLSSLYLKFLSSPIRDSFIPGFPSALGTAAAMLTEEEFAVGCRELVAKSAKFPGFEWTLHERKNSSAPIVRRVEEGAEGRREFHVCYDEVYNVPVLLFNVWHSDGKLLLLEEVWATVSQAEAVRLKSDPWTMITQQEHPIFRNPCLGEKELPAQLAFACVLGRRLEDTDADVPSVGEWRRRNVECAQTTALDQCRFPSQLWEPRSFNGLTL